MQIAEHDLILAYGKLQSYQDRVSTYVRKNKDHLVVAKLTKNIPITETDIKYLESILFDGETIGTKQDSIDHYGDKPLGEFIRGIVGLDIATAQEAFASFIQAGQLSPAIVTIACPVTVFH